MNTSWFMETLPCHPQPEIGECLSGYFVRLAAANGVDDLRTFARSLFPTWPRQRQVHVLQWEYPVDNWGVLPERIHLPVERLVRLTVWPWVAKFRTPPLCTLDKKISPSHFLSEIVRPTLQVCPLCLQEKPYRHLLWRLQPVTICLKHRCLLQGNCHRCGQPLVALSRYQRLLYCAHCGSDLRQLPVVAATEEMLAQEVGQQADWQFLLNPDVSLVEEKVETTDTAFRSLLGRKLRYLREQRYETIPKFTKHSGLGEGIVTNVEGGKLAPLKAYLTYLASVSYSWRELVTLELPADFLAGHSRRKYMSLRICPTPGCPNHVGSSLGVTLREAIPEQKRVRFQCTACGRHFTRTYGGELSTRPQRPEEQKKAYFFAKPEAEVTAVKRLGLRGAPDREIKQQVRWSKYDIYVCWHVLGIEQEVRLARRQRQEEQIQQRRQELRTRVDVILADLLQQEEEITVARVTHALGYRCSYLNGAGYTEIIEHIKTVAEIHRIQFLHLRHERMRAQIEAMIAGCQAKDIPVTVYLIAEEVGVSYGTLRYRHPELMAMVRQVASADKKQRREQQLAQQCSQLNTAAANLMAQGMAVTKTTILQEARKYISIDTTAPSVRQVITRWAGDSGPHDWS